MTTKLEKMKQKSEQLQRRIKNQKAQQKKIEDEIKILSYDSFMAEIGSNNITAEQFLRVSSLLSKLKEHNISYEEFEILAEELIIKNSKENDNEN